MNTLELKKDFKKQITLLKINDNTIKSVRNLFNLKTENEAIKDIKTLFEQEDDYYKTIKIDSFWCKKVMATKIKHYLQYIITDLQNFGTWRIQIIIAINFISFNDTNKERVVHLNSDNINMMTYDNIYEVIKATFESLLSRYRIGLETSMKGRNVIFDSVQQLYYKCHKIHFKRGESPDRIKKQESNNKFKK